METWKCYSCVEISQYGYPYIADKAYRYSNYSLYYFEYIEIGAYIPIEGLQGRVG